MIDGALALVIFPFGVLIGYLWRDRISRARQARYWADHKRREQLRDRRNSTRPSG